jgi:hypothetical protein
MSETTENWDVWIRNEKNSIINKRDTFEVFWDDPTSETLKNTADTWWATIPRWSIDHYVNEVVLNHGHTPQDIRNSIKEVIEGTRSITDADIPGMGVATITEVLEIIGPEQYVAFNKKSRAGMNALGYDVPDDLSSDEEYFAFVSNVKDAIERYDLRDRVADINNVGDLSDVSDIDIAEATFHLHAEDEFSFDLTDIRETKRQTRVEDVAIPQGLYEMIGEVVSDDVLYTDEEDYIKTKLRKAVQNDR